MKEHSTDEEIVLDTTDLYIDDEQNLNEDGYCYFGLYGMADEDEEYPDDSWTNETLV